MNKLVAAAPKTCDTDFMQTNQNKAVAVVPSLLPVVAPQAYGANDDVLGPDFIGQGHLRNRINFMVQGYKESQFIENLLFKSRYGAGKTFACRRIMQNLNGNTNAPKVQIEINSASLQSVGGFFDQIVIPYVASGDKVSLFFDEIDCANPKIHQILLTMLQYDPHTKQSQLRDPRSGANYDISFHNLSVLASTTDAQKIHPALLNRFRCLEMSEYSGDELCKILSKYTNGITFTGDVEQEIIKTSRKSPRHIALRLANDISQYCLQKKKKTFGHADWNNMSHLLRIFPHGISENEFMLLKHLRQNPCTLTTLCGKMCMQPQALRRDVELYLLAEGYMKIETKRMLTTKGTEVLNEIEAWDK